MSLTYPDDRTYHAEHLWAKPEADGAMLVGITDYAQDHLRRDHPDLRRDRGDQRRPRRHPGTAQRRSLRQGLARPRQTRRRR